MKATPSQSPGLGGESSLNDQLELMNSIRRLEEKLALTKARLADSMHSVSQQNRRGEGIDQAPARKPPVVLSKDEYKGLVDLYFYTHRSRFDPESSDSSPTPTFIDDYSFKLSEDFAPAQAYADFYTEDEGYESPLKEIEVRLRSRQLQEITVTKDFVDLLLDDHSSTSTLFRAYKRLPQPGVAFLPRGIIRVFLQRMSTPWQKNGKSMIRYLSLIDDMQQANLPITRSEWASAIYLAGRSFSKVTEAEVTKAFQIWRQMEQHAGVAAHNVTFNILFDIAVRAGKYALAQLILKEMHDRGLRLNRLGRVSVIYYHGLRGDGDAVRKAYRDFVDAGEIVDTLVLNCVIASLFNAQEPSAAELIYERMKSLQEGLRQQDRGDGQVLRYRQYPGPGSSVMEHEMASNSLGRTLTFASRLKGLLPEHHQALQDSMPLSPDHVTFRTMISHHANVSGNLDRITVLMDDMTRIFNLPLQSITFQLLFKGFALQGATRDPDATWSVARLKLVWNSCLEALKQNVAARQQRRSNASAEVTLPSAQADSGAPSGEAAGSQPEEATMGLKRMSTWNEFVLDLAVFPRERRKHIERVHAQLFDDEEERKVSLPQNWTQETYYALGENRIDEEEGEYVLPPPGMAIEPTRDRADADRVDSASSKSPARTRGASSVASQRSPTTLEDSAVSRGLKDGTPSGMGSPAAALPPSSDLDAGDDGDAEQDEEDNDHDQHRPPLSPRSPHQVRPTRPMVCWLLRAFTRCTGSRQEVEEVWDALRTVWKPRDTNERDAVVRVLRRCLRDCDRFGPPL